MLTVLSLRSPLDLNILHDRNPLYVQLSDGSIRNGYDVKILNMTPEPRQVTLSMDGLPGALMNLASANADPVQHLIIEVEPDRVLPLRLYVRVDRENLPESSNGFTFIATSDNGDVRAETKVKFEVPK